MATINTATAAKSKINPAVLSRGQRKMLEKSKKPPGWIYGIARRAKDKMQRWRKPGTPFFVGQKQVYLPSFRIAFLRTPHLLPTEAQFQVPLSVNKLDLRDYLWHLYSVRVLTVRSFIKQAPIMRVEPGSWRDLPGKRKSYRPKATKKMLVTMDKPFVWPEEPKDKREWDHEAFEKVDSYMNQMKMGLKPGKEEQVEREVKLRDLAERLVEGREKWRGGSSAAAGLGLGLGMGMGRSGRATASP